MHPSVPCMHVYMFSYVQLFVTRGLSSARLLCLWDSPGKHTGAGCIFSFRGYSQPRDQAHVASNSCIGRQIVYQLSHHAVLFIMAKTWKRPKYSSTEELIKKMVHIYIMEYYSAWKTNAIIPFAAKWMGPRIYHTNWSKTDKYKYHMISFICGL